MSEISCPFHGSEFMRHRHGRSVPDCAACDAAFLTINEQSRELDRLRAEVERLESLVYVPGLWKCAKCGCAVVSSTLSATTGQVKADDKPQDCPNGCGPMWRRTEREAGNELADRLDASADEANRLRAELARVEAACGEMRAALKRIVNGPWERFTVNTVEARTAQQVLLQILDVANKALASPAGQRTLAVIEAASCIPDELQRMYDGQDRERREKGEIGSIHRDRFESCVDALAEALAALKDPQP